MDGIAVKSHSTHAIAMTIAGRTQGILTNGILAQSRKQWVSCAHHCTITLTNGILVYNCTDQWDTCIQVYNCTDQWDTCVCRCQCRRRPRCQTGHAWCVPIPQRSTCRATHRRTPSSVAQVGETADERSYCHSTPTESPVPVSTSISPVPPSTPASTTDHLYLYPHHSPVPVSTPASTTHHLYLQWHQPYLYLYPHQYQQLLTCTCIQTSLTCTCIHKLFGFWLYFILIFVVSGPCARLSWPSRQLLSAR